MAGSQNNVMYYSELIGRSKKTVRGCRKKDANRAWFCDREDVNREGALLEERSTYVNVFGLSSVHRVHYAQASIDEARNGKVICITLPEIGSPSSDRQSPACKPSRSALPALSSRQDTAFAAANCHGLKFAAIRVIFPAASRNITSIGNCIKHMWTLLHGESNRAC